MATKLQIVNLALQSLGCASIAALDENTKQATVMDRLYDTVRDIALASYRWPFAEKEVSLDNDTDATGNSPFSFAYEMTLPSDTVQAVKEYDDNEYRVLGLRVQTDSSTLRLTYTSNSFSEELFPAEFVKLLYLHLAIEGCNTLVQDKALKGMLIVELEDHFNRYCFHSSHESTSQDYEIDSYLDVRL